MSSSGRSSQEGKFQNLVTMRTVEKHSELSNLAVNSLKIATIYNVDFMQATLLGIWHGINPFHSYSNPKWQVLHPESLFYKLGNKFKSFSIHWLTQGYSASRGQSQDSNSGLLILPLGAFATSLSMRYVTATVKDIVTEWIKSALQFLLSTKIFLTTWGRDFAIYLYILKPFHNAWSTVYFQLVCVKLINENVMIVKVKGM